MEERYPLEAARALRAAEEDARVGELADAMRTLEVAGAAVKDAEHAARTHQEHTDRVRDDESARDGRGRPASETVRAQDWLARRRSEARRLEVSIGAARDVERSAEAAVEHARVRLATARAEREAIEKHFTKWSQARARAVERREDDEADERRR